MFPCPVDPLTDLPVPLEYDNSLLPGEYEVFGDEKISALALCGPNGINEGDVTLSVTARNDKDEPTRVYWEVGNGNVEQVTWEFGSTTRKKVYPNGATSGTIVTDPNVGQPGPSSSSDFCSRSGTSGIKYKENEIKNKNSGDSLPRLKEQLNEISGITFTSEVIDQNEHNAIKSVRDQDSTGGINISGKAIVGPTKGEDVIEVGSGNVTVSNSGAIIGTFTNTGGNDVVITDSAVAGDIGISADGGRLKGTGNVKIESSSTVVGDINTNTDGTNITVKSGGQGNRSQVFGNAITSGGGSIIVQYGRVSGSVETDEGGKVEVKDYSRVDGDAVTSGDGNVIVGNNGPSVVGGVAKTTATSNGAGKVEVVGEPPDQDDTRTPENPAKVLGGVRAGGDAEVEDAEVQNGVEAGADCYIVNSDICGSVIADGNIDVYEYTVIQDGDIEARGTNANVEAGETIAGIQNSFVDGDVIAESGDIDFPSSVICGDIVAKNGAIDIYSEKTGPPLELDPNIPEGQQGGPRPQDRQRSLIGGVVRVEGEDCDIASATVFANGTTEPDKYDDDIAVRVTQKASRGNGLTITGGPTGGSILKGGVVVDGDLNVDIDSGSRVEGKVEANAGIVSLDNVTRSDGRPCCSRATGRVWSHKRGSPQRTGVVTRPPPRRGAHEPGTPTREEVTTGGRRTAPTPHGGILALQGGEDVND